MSYYSNVAKTRQTQLKASVRFCIAKMKTLTLFLILNLTLVLGFRTKNYQKAKIISSDVIKESPSPLYELQCSSICMHEFACEGFKFEEDKVCKPLKNIKTQATDSIESKDGWIDSEMNAIKTKLLVMTGQPVENGIKTEVIDFLDPKNHCISTDFPLALFDSTGGLLGTDLPVVCGGDPAGPSHGTCYVLKDRQFIPKMNLSTPREETGSSNNVVIDGSLILVAGFTGSVRLNTVEAVSLTGMENLPSLPTDAGSPCTVKLDDKRIMTIGGNNGESMKTTFLYDFETKQWTPGPELNNPVAGHACAKFELLGKPIIVVASGYNSLYPGGGKRIPDVEFLDLEANNGWVKGQDLPASLNQHRMVPTPDGKGVLVIGGDVGDDNVQDSIYELKCSSTLESCKWITLEQKLKYAREAFVSMLIPDSLAKDLCKP